MQPEHDIRLMRTHWQVGDVPAGLAERIIMHARSLPQHQPFAVRLAIALRHAFDEWNDALAYKSAVLAAIAIFGLVAGDVTAPLRSSHSTNGVSWTEEL